MENTIDYHKQAEIINIVRMLCIDDKKQFTLGGLNKILSEHKISYAQFIPKRLAELGFIVSIGDNEYKFVEDKPIHVKAVQNMIYQARKYHNDRNKLEVKKTKTINVDIVVPIAGIKGNLRGELAKYTDETLANELRARGYTVTAKKEL